MKSILLVVVTVLCSFQMSFAQCGGTIFFSEYIEGSSSNKATEIYNPTGAPVDLTEYVIYRNNNGSATPTDSLFPNETALASGDVWVFANPGAIAAIQAEADTLHSMTFYNGDDALWIKHIPTGDTIDIIGEIGIDPGSGWTVGTGATNNFTLIRQLTVNDGETNWATSVTEWDVYPIDMIDSLGFHSGPAPAPAGGTILFSEYIEGSSSNKACEIFNCTGATVDLTEYVIYRFNNGSTTATDSLFPNETALAADSVWVFGNPGATAPILNESDTTHSMTFYNGDDALMIKHIPTGDTIDIIGEIGVDPGSGWPVGTGATNNFTLIRKITIGQGQTNWAIGATEWDVYPIDMFDSLGHHNGPVHLPAPTGTTYNVSTSICQGDSIQLQGAYQMTAGSYTDTFTASGGCDSIIITALTIDPNQFNQDPDVTICQGETAMIFGNPQTVAGTYYDSLQTASGCDSIIAIDLIVNPSFFNVLPDVEICQGESAMIFGNLETTAGTYEDTLQTVAGCDSVLSVDLIVHPTHSVNAPAQTICDGDTIIIGSSVVTTAGFYPDTLFTTMGCDSIVTTEVIVTTINTNLSFNGFTITVTQTGATYQWIDCNTMQPIPGETGQSFTATANGSYAVEVTLNGCTETSVCSDITGIGIGETGFASDVRLYPNPANEEVNLTFGELHDELLLSLLSSDGKEILNKRYANQSQIALDLSGLADGMYFIRLQAGEEQATLRLQVRR